MRICNCLRNIFQSMSHREINQKIQKVKKIERKAKNSASVPSYVALQVLGSGVRGIPSSLYVSTDHSKYLFNCGEGVQRLAQEHRLRLTKLENVFFTTPTWKNMGGFPGMILTIQDIGVPALRLHGPRGIYKIFDAIRPFVQLKNIEITEAECNESDCYVDDCMKINYVHLKKNTSEIDSDDSDDDEQMFIDNTDYYAHEFNSNGKRNATKHTPAKKISKQINNQQTNGRIKGCISYICKLHDKPGTLNLEKCVDRGVTPGPILGQLKSGNDVTLDNGTIIKSADVCDPSIPGPVFIVIECPNEDYLDSLINNEVFKNYQKDASDPENIAKCIVHFSPENIIRNPRYIEWMSRFENDTEHLIINENNSCLSYEGIHKIQHKLNLLHPTIFPLIHDQFPAVESTEYPIESECLKKLNIHRAKTLDAVHLRPQSGLENTKIKIDRETDVNEVFNIDGFLDLLAELQTDINARSKYINESEAYPKILMLGTGSCIPCKIRNTSGILLRIDEDTSVLLDCGEGTIGQLIRFFGPSEIDKIVNSIKAVYVSHLHADHHLGLLGVLQERQRITNEPIFLLAPNKIEFWLRLYNKKFERIATNYILVPNHCLNYNSRKIANFAYNELKKKLRLNDVYTIEVYHCPFAFAVAWTLKNGKKIVYSGDTRPCYNITSIGKYCDLLIHEATMEDELEKEAKKKKHSTISEALMVGEEMKAKFTLLTHFSQRYSKMPRLPNDSDILNNVGIAFDNMQFNLAELSLLPLFYPSLKLMFNEFCNELEEKAHKRIIRQKTIAEMLNS
ncbi:hypothetical protein PV327_009328 [Microctonus hyperodae]|uniref:Zinc phosphodiesterase ELAC protein 2 n=1 Tax=Microctonus hyperodae TaxID=165561 RepID=A0AA39FTY1_MICHY|nr:hypothetical protein PV327_009328 [Microctonus hyperodae]